MSLTYINANPENLYRATILIGSSRASNLDRDLIKRIFLSEFIMKVRPKEELDIIDTNLVLSEFLVDLIKNSGGNYKYNGESLPLVDVFVKLYPETVKRYSKHFINKISLDFKTCLDLVTSNPKEYGLATYRTDNTILDYIMAAIRLSKARVLDDSNGDITHIVKKYTGNPNNYSSNIIPEGFNVGLIEDTFNLDMFIDMLCQSPSDTVLSSLGISLITTNFLHVVKSDSKVYDFLDTEDFLGTMKITYLPYGMKISPAFLDKFKCKFALKRKNGYPILITASVQHWGDLRNIEIDYSDVYQLLNPSLIGGEFVPIFDAKIVSKFISTLDLKNIPTPTVSKTITVKPEWFVGDSYKIFEDYFVENIPDMLRFVGFSDLSRPDRINGYMFSQAIKNMGPTVFKAVYNYLNSMQTNKSTLMGKLFTALPLSDSKKMLFDSGIMGLQDYTRFYLLKTSSDDMSIFDTMKDSITPEEYIDILKIVVNENKRAIGTYKKYVEDTQFLHFYNLLMENGNIQSHKKRLLLQEAYDLIKINPKTGNVRDNYAANILVESIVVKVGLDDVSQNNVIPLLKKVTAQDVEKILRFNNFTVAESELPKYNDKKMDLSQFLQESKGKKISLPPLKITKVDRTQEELEKKSGEYSKYYNTRHGDTGIVILEEFDVDLKNPEMDEWIKNNPNPTVIPAFHGTGSIAASMILRFGFKIVKKDIGGIATTGKMLGDGVYFSNVISKAIQYLGDDGYSRSIGTVGYLLEMEAYLGKKDTDYREAGTGGDSIRSPEWCVFNPRAQLKIVKAYKCKIVSGAVIRDFKTRYNTITEGRNMSFKQFITEETAAKVVTNFVFMDGTVPNKAGSDVISYDEYKHKNGSTVGYSQDGPEITINGGEETQSIMIPNTREFMRKNPEGLYALWRKLTK